VSVAARLAGALALAFALVGAGPALADVAVPPLTGHVTDQTGTLTGEQKAALEQTLQAFEAAKGSQLAVLLVATTAPESIEQYSLRVVEKWKLGRKKIDDGALLLIAKEDRTMRIEVGYGLEGALNDATAKRIISEVITPRFKQGDFYGGIKAGTDRMISVVNGEPLPPPAQAPTQGQGNRGAGGLADLEGYVPVIFVLAVVVGGVLRAMFGRFPGALLTGGATAVIAWLVVGGITMAAIAGLIAAVVTLFGGGLGGFMGGGGFRGGGYGGGGGGGGGYSGGGGGFGGGGASGKW
jgi:uncharacterized protein